MKLAPVIAALKRDSRRFETVVINSGHHTDLLRPFLDRFCLDVDHDLNVMQSGQMPNQARADPLGPRPGPDDFGLSKPVIHAYSRGPAPEISDREFGPHPGHCTYRFWQSKLIRRPSPIWRPGAEGPKDGQFDYKSLSDKKVVRWVANIRPNVS
jgi:hypothetical protein